MEMRVRPNYPIEKPHYSLYMKLCGPHRGSVLCGEDKNILHHPEIEHNIVQLTVCSLNLLSYFGLPVHSHTLLSQATQKGLQPPKMPRHLHDGEWLPRARLVPHFLFIFQLGFPSPPAPRPPLAPLSIDAIVPHFLQLLHFLFSFVSSFPHFKKWKTLSFRNKETSGLGLEGQFFRTWQIPFRLVPSETQSSAQRIRLSCEISFFASIWVRNKLMNFCLVANDCVFSKRLFYTAESAERSVPRVETLLHYECCSPRAVSLIRFLIPITAGAAHTSCSALTWLNVISF